MINTLCFISLCPIVHSVISYKKQSMINKSELTEHGLAQYIKEYESDTFTAEGSEITDDEALRVARRIIQWTVDNRLDGVMIDEFLSDIRE